MHLTQLDTGNCRSNFSASKEWSHPYFWLTAWCEGWNIRRQGKLFCPAVARSCLKDYVLVFCSVEWNVSSVSTKNQTHTPHLKSWETQALFRCSHLPHFACSLTMWSGSWSMVSVMPCAMLIRRLSVDSVCTFVQMKNSHPLIGICCRFCASSCTVRAEYHMSNHVLSFLITTECADVRSAGFFSVHLLNVCNIWINTDRYSQIKLLIPPCENLKCATWGCTSSRSIVCVNEVACDKKHVNNCNMIAGSQLLYWLVDSPL